MAEKRFGVSQAPGVAVIEQEGAGRIVPADLGTTALVGIFTKGTVNKLEEINSLQEFRKKMGVLTPDSFAPDAAHGFFRENRGAGLLYCLRVTDGTEEKGTLTLKNRVATANLVNVVRLDAKNGGRWGGRRQVHAAITPTAATATVITAPMPAGVVVNELIGATIQKDTAPTIIYPVISNTLVDITTASNFDFTTNFPLGTEPFTVTLLNEGKGLVAVIGDGKLDPANEWSLTLYLDGNLMRVWDNLSSVTTSPRYFVNMINDDTGNEWITAADLFTGTPDATTRPANAYGAATSVTNNVLTDSAAAFAVDELIGGQLYPDPVNEPEKRFRIIDNDATTVSVEPTTTDLSTINSGTDQYRVDGPVPQGTSPVISGFGLGSDGIAAIADATYQAALNKATSPINELLVKRKGLVKIAVPGVNTVAVQKDGVDYAVDKGYQFRIEIPKTTLTAETAELYVNTTLNKRSAFSVVHFPSYSFINDPEKPGALKEIPLVGDILGEEARIAGEFVGYHKAGAGLDAVLSRVAKLSVELSAADMERLNPQGINAIILKPGIGTVIWGDRTLTNTPTFQFKHQREQLSHYERILLESLDFIIFAINDMKARKRVSVAIREFFLTEFNNRALKGSSFDDAFVLKIDEEINTPATEAAGELHAEISLKLADTVERFIILIGQKAIFEDVSVAA